MDVNVSEEYTASFFRAEGTEVIRFFETLLSTYVSELRYNLEDEHPHSIHVFKIYFCTSTQT
jgi:hypothetical protein